MISIIICSRDATLLAAVSRNVADTIDLPHEIIAIDNSQRRYGICEAYTIGAARAQYEQCLKIDFWNRDTLWLAKQYFKD